MHFTPDYVARPTIGYARDNFGRGFFGGSAISLSDMLGNHQLVFAGYVNGRINEAQVLAAYANLSHRINWAVGIDPGPVLLPRAEHRSSSSPATGRQHLRHQHPAADRALGVRRRPTTRSAGSSGSRRALRFANVDDAAPADQRAVRSQHGFATADPFLETDNRPGVNYVQPSLALVFDNSLHRVRGPVLRPPLPVRVRPVDRRLDVHPGHGRLPALRPDRRARRAGHARPVLRPDRAGRGPVPDLRGQHRSDPRQHLGLVPAERVPQRQRSPTTRDRLRRARPPGRHPDRGRQRRAPLSDPQPVISGPGSGFPPIEGALFYDIGLVWDERARLNGAASPGDDPVERADAAPDHSALVRTNLFGFAIARLDYRHSRRTAGGREGSGPSASDRRSEPTRTGDGRLAQPPYCLPLPLASPLSFRACISIRPYGPRRWPCCSARACGGEPEHLAAGNLPASARRPAPVVSVLRFPQDGGLARLYRVPPRSVIVEGRGQAAADRAHRRRRRRAGPRLRARPQAQPGHARPRDPPGPHLPRAGPRGDAGPDGALYAVDTGSTVTQMVRRAPVRFRSKLQGKPAELYATMTGALLARVGDKARVSRCSARIRRRSRRTLPDGHDRAELLWRPGGGRHRYRGHPLPDPGPEARPRRSACRGRRPGGALLAVRATGSTSPRTDDALLVLDRFSGEPAATRSTCPAPPRALRGDRYGQWLLVQPAIGDSRLGHRRRHAATDRGTVPQRAGPPTCRPSRRPTRCWCGGARTSWRSTWAPRASRVGHGSTAAPSDAWLPARRGTRRRTTTSRWTPTRRAPGRRRQRARRRHRCTSR